MRCGGDVPRKRKLLDKQKEGKKRMRQFGKGGHSAVHTYVKYEFPISFCAQSKVHQRNLAEALTAAG